MVLSKKPNDAVRQKAKNSRILKDALSEANKNKQKTGIGMTQTELDALNKIVSAYLDIAEVRALAHEPMYMKF